MSPSRVSGRWPCNLVLLSRSLRPNFFVVALCVVLVGAAFPARVSAASAVGQDEACPRLEVGSTVVDPPELRSQDGVLEVTLHFRYQATFAGQGPPRYCYVTDHGEESPTLRVRPGDLLVIHFQNDLPQERAVGVAAADTSHKMSVGSGDCAPGPMTSSVTNLHFHGMNVPPTCHQDDVIDTRIQPGEEFEYRVRIPLEETPGLYWYHPHPHGFSEKQVLGGASGALIVEGIAQARPEVARLRERLLVLRDQAVTNLRDPIYITPAWDISLNYTPVLYPGYRPATIETSAAKEFWRVVNAGANTIFDLQLLSRGVAQPLQVVALDGVPVKAGAEPPATHVLLPPGARVEVVAPMPKAGQQAELVTRKWDTGPQGDNDPARPIAYVVNRGKGEGASPDRNAGQTPPATRHPQQEKKLLVERHLYFSQLTPNPNEPDTSIFYFITVAGQQPREYRMRQPPNIVVHQGDVENWTVENRAEEDHVFHIHQIHFRVLQVNGQPVANGELLDTINLPHWDGSGPYPSVKVRMDFRDPHIVGTFLYHCHILKHEDMGMMGSIQVLPPGVQTSLRLSTPSRNLDVATTITVTARVAAKSGQQPAGSVQFAVDGINAGRPVPLAEQLAGFTTSFEDSGAHRITATYSGDASHDESVAEISIHVAGGN